MRPSDRPGPPPHAPDLRGRQVVRPALVVLAVAAGLALAWLARHILLLGFTGVLMATVFSYPVGWLSRLVPRGVAVVVLLLALAGLGAGFGFAAAPLLSRQAEELSESTPRALRAATAWLQRLDRAGSPARAPAPRPTPAPSVAERVPQAVEVGAKALPAVLGVLVGITEVLLVIVLAAFLVYRPDAYRRGLRRLVPREREAGFDELWDRLRTALRQWVGGIVVAMGIMGTLTALGLWAAGIEGWFLLGLLTFVGTFVPYLGAVASAVPGILSALAQSTRHALLALVVYAGVHVVEGYMVEPYIMRRAVALNPALLLLGQGAFAAVFGVLGVVVATPALVCLQVAVEALWVERRLGK